MHIGFQTISFGKALRDNGRSMLNAVSEMGYEGVEIAQNPSEFRSAKQLYQCLRESNLKLLGLSGGSVERRIKFAGELIKAEDKVLTKEISVAIRKGKKAKRAKDRPCLRVTKRIIRFAKGEKMYPYIYIDNWDEVLAARYVHEYTLAVHTHMFTPFQTAKETGAVLSRYSELGFLPDTAHLTVAGEDVILVLYENYDRIIAVHLKDWTSEFGRSYQFYSRGFRVRFGQGDVNLNGVVNFLKNPEPPEGCQDNTKILYSPFDKWIIVEQDKVDDPYEAAEQSLTWLRSTLEN